MGPEVSGKRLQLLQELVPGLAKVALFWDSSDPGTEFSVKETQAAAETLSLKLQVLETRGADEFDAAFQAAANEEARAVILLPAPVMGSNRKRIADLALRQGLPTMFFSDVHLSPCADFRDRLCRRPSKKMHEGLPTPIAASTTSYRSSSTPGSPPSKPGNSPPNLQ